MCSTWADFFPIVPFFRHFGKVAKRFLVCAMASLWYSSHHSRRRPVSCQGHRMLRGFDSNWQWVKNHIASALHIHEFLSNLPFFDQHAVGPNIWRIWHLSSSLWILTLHQLIFVDSTSKGYICNHLWMVDFPLLDYLATARNKKNMMFSHPKMVDDKTGSWDLF